MYAFENMPVMDGEKAFGIEGTTRINNRIYVLRPEADGFLLNELGRQDYILEKTEDENVCYARRTHEPTQKEYIDAMITGGNVFSPLSLIVDFTYADGHKHSLAEPLIHETILSAAKQRNDLEYHNRPTDHFGTAVIRRMGAFVRHMVDVDYAQWESFERQARHLQAQDFIKSMAAWASRNSDNTPRKVQINTQRSEHAVVKPTDVFARRLRADSLRFDL